ncbi:IS3 family transposase [Bdellovibrionota bacterium FG-2]
MEDRKQCMELVQEAEKNGAGRADSCQILELSLRTLERWEKNPEQGDLREGPLTSPPHSLTEAERKKIIEISNSALYQDLCPWKIVAKLADSGVYLASESSFYRVLKAENLLSHRSKSKPRERQRPKDLIAASPNIVWSWDITYLKSAIKGSFYYLYLVMDIYSRYIVGWTVEEVESAEHSARLITRICREQGVTEDQLTLHSDNGGPMKGATMLATLQKLHVAPSFSRPSVSNDNAFSESLFKTLKYRPSYPDWAFANLEEARTWVEKFVTWYNTEHLHSGIRFVTPQSRHEGKDAAILSNRHDVYEKAKLANPSRWSGGTRNWSMINEVRLNPGKETKKEIEKLRNQAA